MENDRSNRHDHDDDLEGFSDSDKLLLRNATDRELLILVLKEVRVTSVGLNTIATRFNSHEVQCTDRHQKNDKVFATMAQRDEKEMVKEGVRLWWKSFFQNLFYFAAGIATLSTAAAIIWGVFKYVSKTAVGSP